MSGEIALHSRSLAKDGLRRAEVRAICAGPLVDYSGASWGEWQTLEAVAAACSAFRSHSEKPRSDK